jgi:hypothetical protein
MSGAQPSRLLELGTQTDKGKRGRLRSSQISKIFIDDFSLLFYYHLNTGKEVI